MVHYGYYSNSDFVETERGVNDLRMDGLKQDRRRCDCRDTFRPFLMKGQSYIECQSCHKIFPN